MRLGIVCYNLSGFMMLSLTLNAVKYIMSTNGRKNKIHQEKSLRKTKCFEVS